MARADYQCCAKCEQKIVYAGTTDYRDDACLCGICAKEIESQLAEALDKALRFDLDQAGIEAREREAVELVELRAKLAEAERTIAHTKAEANRMRDLAEGWINAHARAAQDLTEAERTIESQRDELADVENAMLRRFDPRAAESTDLYTWITCLIYKRDAAERTIAELRRELKRAQALQCRDRDDKIIAQAAANRMLVICHDDLPKVIAERDEARRVAVWAVRNAIEAGPVYLASPLRDNWTREHVLKHDGTDSGIYAALRRAMGDSDAKL